MATLGSKSVGSIVKLKVNGTLRDFIVVHQGKPSSLYDSSCDGTWLLMKDIYENRAWHYLNSNSYSASSIHYYLNNVFLDLFDANIKSAIKQVRIPYVNGTANSAVASGSSGLSAKIFLLSGYEVGWTNSDNKYFPVDGAKLSYFSAGTGSSANNKRIAYLNGSAARWWLRCPVTDSSNSAWFVYSNGSYNTSSCSGSYGVRPALVLPSTLLVSDDGTISTNTAPTTPSSITVPTTVIGGQNITVSWGASTDSDSNLSGYILERKADSGAWTQVYKGSSRSATVSITYGWNSVQFRVKAYDSQAAESSYRTSDTRTVTNNRTPAISGSNSNLGSFSETSPSYSYTVTDADRDAVTVVETLDGKTNRSYTVTLGVENMFTLDADTWQRVLNGSHTLAIKATDSKGASATRTLTFAKAVTSISFEQTIAMPADDMPMKALLNIQGSFPAGSILKVEICNNGNDDEPAWEDVTNRVINGQKCYFSNTEKTAGSWGVKIRVNLSRGTATEPCYIQTLGGNFG